MRDAATALRVAADHFASGALARMPSDIEEGHALASAVLDELPPEQGARVRAALAAALANPANGRAVAQALDQIAGELAPPAKPARLARQRERRPSIRAQIAAAEKAGKTVTSITLPDGTMLQFGAPAPAEASNPWLADLTKVKQ